MGGIGDLVPVASAAAAAALYGLTPERLPSLRPGGDFWFRGWSLDRVDLGTSGVGKPKSVALLRRRLGCDCPFAFLGWGVVACNVVSFVS